MVIRLCCEHIFVACALGSKIPCNEIIIHQFSLTSIIFLSYYGEGKHVPRSSNRVFPGDLEHPGGNAISPPDAFLIHHSPAGD